MCNAFSCIVTREKKPVWKFGTDSHDELLRIAKIDDDTKDPKLIKFCRIEISPKNNNYLEPDKWIFRVDMDFTPAWWTEDHEKAAWGAFQEWSKLLDAVLVRKPIIHPFHITPPEITDEHIRLLKEWASVRASVRASVMASVGDSVGVSVWDSVVASVGVSVWGSVGNSVWASVGAYYGSFFILPPRQGWKYTGNIKTDKYPFQRLVTLWEQGLVPSFDGKNWRLHGGPDAKILWEGVL